MITSAGDVFRRLSKLCSLTVLYVLFFGSCTSCAHVQYDNDVVLLCLDSWLPFFISALSSSSPVGGRL